MNNESIKDLYIALDLTRYLADGERANNTLTDAEKRLAQTIADKLAQYIRGNK
jgi:hypothetical protein